MSIVVNVTFRFFMRSPFVELRQKYKILQRFGEKKLRCDNHPAFNATARQARAEQVDLNNSR